MPSMPEHAAVRQHLEAKLQDPDTRLVLTPMILHELIHVITDPRRFEPPVDMIEALSIGRLYLGRKNIECLMTGEAETRRAFDLIQRHRLGRRRLADSLFASTLIEAGVTALLTCNETDYRIFEELTVIDPRHP
jgi:predicted nucleic acid-binding protein